MVNDTVVGGVGVEDGSFNGHARVWLSNGLVQLAMTTARGPRVVFFDDAVAEIETLGPLALAAPGALVTQDEVCGSTGPPRRQRGRGGRVGRRPGAAAHAVGGLDVRKELQW